jgi:hypothetical protein
MLMASGAQAEVDKVQEILECTEGSEVAVHAS